ncbi:MAG TPA: LruC domain-containing protein [Spirochaetota bacterium]|nr:LruC domain-containing protein [Spirochaetota bacterium]
MKKGLIFGLFVALISAVVITSCGGGGGGASKAPNVVVVPDSSTNTGTTTGSGDISGGNSSTVGDNSNTGAGSGTTEGSTTGTEGNSNYVILIEANNGNLSINNEYVSQNSYNPANNPKAQIKITDENSNSVQWSIDGSGNIKIVPADGSVEGTYTVNISTGEREYVLIINVDGNNSVTVTTSISYPTGSAIAVDLDHGRLIVNNEVVAAISSCNSSGYTQSSSVVSITVKDSAGKILASSIDPVTGDIIVSGSSLSNYNITIVMDDGRVISFQTGNSGAIVGNVTIAGRATMVDLENGTFNNGTETIVISENSGGTWALASDVNFISATAGGGTITVPLANIKIDSATGDILITGGGTADVPSGPYEIKISVDGKEYIIKTNETGQIVDIIPGNTLLILQNGWAEYSGNKIVQIATGTTGSYVLNSQISNFEAKDSNGSSVSAVIDRNTGNILTYNHAVDVVTITFDYSDSKGNVITYTIVVQNGSINSYSALITNPSSDFDFSTVTNIKIFLKVTNEKTGLPLGQVSINLKKSNGDLNWQGFTDDNGLSVFTATVETAANTAHVVVSKEGFYNVECAIDGIGKLIEFGKNIAMKPVEEAVVVDTDGDGVSDNDDEFPNDPTAAKSVEGVYTLAFEDLYPTAGDADVNDLVVRLTIKEIIDSQNKVRRIDLKTKLLASGAGYTNQFWINIYELDSNGAIVKTYKRELIHNPKANTPYTLGSIWNTKNSETYRNCEELIQESIVFEGGIDRKSLSSMPYDPYIVCNGVAGKESHLPFVKTIFTGQVKDSNGFPWAILVPYNWLWPCDGSNIYKAYPLFSSWCTSGGDNYSNWYLTPEPNYIYRNRTDLNN